MRWFYVKDGYVYINQTDYSEDIFIHHSAVVHNHPQTTKRSVREREALLFAVVPEEKGPQAANLKGTMEDQLKRVHTQPTSGAL